MINIYNPSNQGRANPAILLTRDLGHEIRIAR